ncbi:thymidylate kinase [Xanthomonas phage vB_XciM_LucasX]|nr:thymidylate kinase [Xanthomonas phage vB_XciM_LucasX]
MSSHQPSGHFIVIEGPDGSGKTTQLKLLKDWLENAGHEVVVAREPGGTKWGMEIRRIFLEGQGELDPMAEVMLLLAAKAQVLREVIYPAYNTGKIVLMDRYSDSLLAYQGGGRQLGLRVLQDVLRAAELNFPPTLSIYIDTTLETCMQRISMRPGAENNSIDALGTAYHQRVHRVYHQLAEDARLCGRPYAVVDGGSSAEDVHLDVLSHLPNALHKHSPVRAMQGRGSFGGVFQVIEESPVCEVALRD